MLGWEGVEGEHVSLGFFEQRGDLGQPTWLVGRSYISQKSMATLSDRGASTDHDLNEEGKEVELIAA